MTDREDKIRDILTNLQKTEVEKYTSCGKDIYLSRFSMKIDTALKEILELDSFWHEYYKDILTQMHTEHKEEIARYKEALERIATGEHCGLHYCGIIAQQALKA